MKRIAEFIQEARFLKHLPRSGYHYLGAGRESVAEHVYTATMIAYVLAQLVPEADTQRLLTMSLFHDLPEARLGDLNYVQKNYVTPDENLAVRDMIKNLPFGQNISELLDEYNACETLESKLVHDADQLSLILDLKHLCDIGHQTAETWIPHVQDRLLTDIGIQLAQTVLSESWDGWWRKIFA